MKQVVFAFRILLSVIGAALIILGIIFWTGHALWLLPAHIVLGCLLVLCLWGLVGLAAFAKAPWPFVALVFTWSLVVPVLGFTQGYLLPGPWHWTVQALHLLVGIAAIGLGHRLATRISGAPHMSCRRPATNARRRDEFA